MGLCLLSFQLKHANNVHCALRSIHLPFSVQLNVNVHGISNPCGNSRGYYLLPVMRKLMLDCCRNNKQIDDIFSGTCPTIVESLVTMCYSKSIFSISRFSRQCLANHRNPYILVFMHGILLSLSLIRD